MALETVLVTVQDDEVVPNLVDDVVVRVFDSDGTTLITEGTTGSVLDGAVEVSLDGDDPPVQYQLRFYINGGAIPSPQYITVYSPASSAPNGTNEFLITASLFTLPTASNPRLCRASGYVWGPNGRARRGIDVAFIPAFSPVIVDGIGLLGERVNLKTDKEGYLEVDLVRTALYYATVESHENVTREVVVPDRSSVNIMHLLFPIVIDVELGTSSISLSVDGELVLTPVVTASDYRILDGSGKDDVTYTIDHTDVASVTVGADTITIRGNSVGTTSLRIARTDTSIIYLPDPGIDGAVIPITIS